MSNNSDSVQVSVWLQKLNAALEAMNAEAAAALFDDECYWRDLLAFTWNIKTAEGRRSIAEMLAFALPHTMPRNLNIQGATERKGEVIEAWFNFETGVAVCTGHLRLKSGKGFTVLTSMDSLKGHEECTGFTREAGIVHGAAKGRRTWKDARKEEEHELGFSRQPYCVIIGGGQGGIALGARLRQLNVPTIILEKDLRAGDSWRNRYRSLVLHDPVWYDHMPYLPFPEHWPIFTPKDKMGDWLEAYTKIMELNYWTSSEATKAEFDEAEKVWIVNVVRDGQKFVLRPKHLVLATGSYGPPREVDIPGKSDFSGVQYHSSKHLSGAEYQGKQCIVVGANSSAHDICVDMWENGAVATMIQRTPTTVVRSESLMNVAFLGLYSEAAVKSGIDVDKADMMFASMPFRLMADVQKPLYDEIAKRDADIVARLNKAGFMTDYGPDGSGLLMKALRTGSGYYIDVGCSELIAKGDVKVRSGVEFKQINSSSVTLTDGSEIPADVIVYATGYLPMNEWVAKIISREVAELIGPNWGYGSGTRGDPGPWEGELRNMWKPLRHDALWFHGGNLHLSRHYSKYVALQLKARMENIPTLICQ